MLCELVFGSKGENGGSVPAFSPFPAPLAMNHAPAARPAEQGSEARRVPRGPVRDGRGTKQGV